MMRQCIWCGQFRPDDADSQYMVEVIENCNSPDGDGHLWKEMVIDLVRLNYTAKEIFEMKPNRKTQLKRMLAEHLATPREKEARELANLIREIEGQRYGWWVA